MDGLPGLQRGIEVAQKEEVPPIQKMKGPYAPSKPRKVPLSFSLEIMILVALASFALGLLIAYKHCLDLHTAQANGP